MLDSIQFPPTRGGEALDSIQFPPTKGEEVLDFIQSPPKGGWEVLDSITNSFPLDGGGPGWGWLHIVTLYMKHDTGWEKTPESVS